MSPRTWVRLLGLSCVLIAAGFAVPALTDDAKKGTSYALLVGVKDYSRATLGELKYTENDVEELAKVLDKPGSPFHKNVRILTCSRGKKDKADAPTAANIAKALAALVKGKKNGDTVLVALAGHGLQLTVRDPKDKGKEKSFAYFCPQDADPHAADYDTGRHGRMVLLSDLLGDLRDCGAGTKLMLMDACRNERSSRSLRLNKELVPDGVAALFSCKTGQMAFETKKLGRGHGVFFHHVIEALKGEARDKLGRVTWGRMVEHVTGRVTEDVPTLIGGGAKQTPHEIKNFAGRSPVLVSGLKPEEKDGSKVIKEDGDNITNSVRMKFVRVKKGKFTMGSPKGEEDREPFDKGNERQHEVEITKDFYLGVYEVTQGQFREVMGFNPSYFSLDGKTAPTGKYESFSKPGGGKERVKDFTQKELDGFPVETVSWDDAQEFLDKLNARAAEKEKGREYCLPTEAQWEYACRGGPSSSNKPFHFKQPSDSLSTSQANFYGSYPYGGAKQGKSLNRTEKVGSYQANRLGLYDMHGNVWEWCADWYDEGYYANSPARDPLCLKGSSRVYRGG